MVAEFKGATLLVPKLKIGHSSETIHIIRIFGFEEREFYKNLLPQISVYNSVLPTLSTCTVHVCFRDFTIITIADILHTTHDSS